ncbi:MAG: lytic transglycosylase [Bacteroidetes bacterium HGW-Bacteroidetes-1]|jgi:membrane-bound lytic murein transglycosylase D|nr:MAG: lytic transglycosylase [Bacteroidetes bacterium HGW-Bacteroidetes-1]
MTKFKLAVFCFLIVLAGNVKSQSEVEELLGDTTIIVTADTNLPISTEFLDEQSKQAFADDSPIVKMLDSLFQITYFNDSLRVFDTTVLNRYGYDALEIPNFSDSIYRVRIQNLDRETPIPLVFNNHVKDFINLYSIRKRGLTSRMLGLSYVYFPMFEELLDRYNIPLEMKYLAMVESALNPTAGSHMGAKGLWQFMYGTGKVYNLKVTSLVDDRFDPYKSTEAACQHMLDLYNIYEDWFLVLAAYNAGAGNVNRAIRRAGGVKDYWAIWQYLPRETRGYVPAFIAVNYVMNYSAEHNLYPVHPGMIMVGTDTVTVSEPLSFYQLNEMLGIPMADLRFFNPQFKGDIIPASKENPYILRIPNGFIGSYLNNEQELYAYKTKKGIEKETILAEVKKVSDRTVHTVRRGENLGLIANKYRVSVKQLQSWNNMRSTKLQVGQKLVVFSSGTPVNQPGETPVARSTQSVFHSVKGGETLGLIASKYKCSVTDLREWNNIKGSTINIGQKLRVYPPEQQASSQASSNGKYITYTVKSGDTLWDIARKYDGVTVEQIKKMNNLNSKSQIKPGQKLRIASVT